MELGASIARKVVEDVERQLIAAVSDDGVKLAQLDPNVEREEMGANDDRGSEGSGSEDDDLSPVRVGSAKTEGSLELVVDLVDLLVEPLDVQPAMTPVLEPVLTDEEEAQLPSEGPKRRPLTIVTHAQEIEDGPSANDHGDDDNDVVEEDVLDTRPVVDHGIQLGGLNLVFLHPAQLLNNDENSSRPDV